MWGLGILVSAAGLTGDQKLQLVAVLLGVLVFGIVVLMAERRNHGHEAAPPGMTARDAPSVAPRQVYHPPARSVPTMSARVAADEEAPANPYPVPFVKGAEAESPAEPGAPADDPASPGSS